MRTLLALTLSLGVLVTGCREDAGAPNAALLEGWETPAGLFPEAIEGPDPYVEGEARFALGLFYEGGNSDYSPIDGTSSNYFIFEAYPGGPLTYTQLEDDQSRVEGLTSTRIVHAGLTFWGGGIFWSSPRNVARWTELHVALRSTSDAFAEITLGVQSGGQDHTVAASDYGYVNDGAWHLITVPLIDFVDAGADLSALTSPFFFGGGAGLSGEYFSIDDLYWSAP